MKRLIIAKVMPTENGVEIQGCIVLALSPLEYALAGQDLENLGFQELKPEDRERLMRELVRESIDKPLFLSRSE